MIVVKTLTFEEILPIWNIDLWPNRKSEIKPMSSMVYLGGYDMSIYQKYKPTFFSLQINDQIIGVNSGFRTDDHLYRIRGIWINSDYQRQGMSKKLFEALENQAIEENCTHIWSLPRKISLACFKAFDFEQTSEWFDENMEFGPNCYVLKDINYAV